MELKRRDFLQWSGIGLGTWIGWELWRSNWLDATAQAASLDASKQSSTRALLIGIDRYDSATGFPPLTGCLMDVELQRRLLEYRLGWPVQNIRVLTNHQATSAAICQAIKSELLANASSGDVLFLHFSGYGRMVASQGPTLVPYDAQASGEQDISLQTLSQLKIPAGVKFYCCFDTSFSPPAGSDVIPPRGLPSLGSMSSDSLPHPPPGMTWLYPTRTYVLTLAGTSAGALTHALTQHLWQNPLTYPLTTYAAVQNLERQTGESVHVHWQPEAQSRNVSGFSLSSSPFMAQTGIDAVVLNPEESYQLWLGGLSSSLVNLGGWQSQFQVISSSESDSAPMVTGQTPMGLLTPVIDAHLSPGTFLQERIRHLPHHLNLTLGLAPQLDKVTRIDAVSGLDSLSDWVTVVSEGEGDINLVALEGDEHSLYGLAWPGGTLIPHTLGSPGEAVKGAIRRLGAFFPVFLAHKLLSLSLNGTTSGLGVSLAWEKVLPQPELILRVDTERAPWPVPEPPLANISPAIWERGITFQVGEQFRYQVTNFSPERVYGLWLAWDSAAGLLMLPLGRESNASEWQLTLAPQMKVSLPERNLRYASPSVNSYLVFSRTPFQQTLNYLNDMTVAGDPPLHIPNPQSLPLVQAILQDLSADAPTNNSYHLDLQAWATFCFTFRVV